MWDTCRSRIRSRPLLQAAVARALAAERLAHAIGGTYVVMEGPQFSTLAELQLYRSWDAHVIGMTNMPEAKLAREAEICYCTVAMVTDYDSWHEEHGYGRCCQGDRGDAVKFRQCAAPRAAHRAGAAADHQPCPIGSDRALEHAIMTAPAKRDPAVLAKLDAVAGRVLKR